MGDAYHTEAEPRTIGALTVVPFVHPQGCRSYLVGDPDSREALAIDVHLDLVHEVVHRVEAEGWNLAWVVDTHTHADHPSGAAALAAAENAVRASRGGPGHAGVTHVLDDGSSLALGDHEFQARLTPGHTPDSLVIVTPGAVFAGDSLLIGAVARADFIGGDPGSLYDSIHNVLMALPDDTVLFPGHDYEGRVESTIGHERTSNPWLLLGGRDAFVSALSGNRPPQPANMDVLLEFNREGRPFLPQTSARETVARVRAGGAGTVIDIRTAPEIEAEHVPGSRLILLDEIVARVDEVLATPVPRLILCHSGQRAEFVREFLTRAGVAGLSVVAGGIVAYAAAGGETVRGAKWEPAAGGGGCAASAPPPTGGCAAAPPPGTD